MVRIRPLLVPLALVAVLVGCAAPAADDPVETASPTPAPAAEGFSIAELVAQLPALDGQVLVSVGDVESATELAGQGRPEEPGEALADWVLATSGIEVGSAAALPWPGSLGVPYVHTHADFMAAVGFGIPQVDAFLEAAAPPTSFTLVDGRFDPAAITAAIGDLADGVWAQPGEELAADLAGDRSVDPLGRPVFVAGDDSRLVLSLERDLAADYAAGRTDPSPGLAEVANALDDEGAYAAMLWSDGSTVRAVGLLPDGEGGSTAIAVVLDPDAVAPSVGDTESTWSVTAVEPSGSATVVRLDAGGAPPAGAYRLLQMFSPLVGGR